MTRRLPAPIEARMAELFDATFSPDDAQLSGPELVAALADKDVLVSSITDRLDAGLIASLPPGLRMIAQFGNGYDNIDIEAAYRAGLVVTNTPSVLTEDTADMAMALMLGLPRRLIEGAQVLVEDGAFAGWSPTWMMGRRLRGKSLGIVGLGRIGTAVAIRARAFGLNIHYFSRNRRPPMLEERLEATYWPELDRMIPEMDIISLHMPLTRDTFHILNAERLARMKQDAFLVNVSRPELIDEEALVQNIESRHLSGAALDVFEYRPRLNPRLLTLARSNKVLMTPHMASATLEARVEMGETVIVNIRAFVDGHQPPHRVLPESRLGGRAAGAA